MKYLISTDLNVERLQGKAYLCRVETEKTSKGPDVVIRISFSQEETAERVAKELTEGLE
jgi:hypothetical protein